jgi:endonuclease/exonuclease/phosphatase family metal-dependent hydrolase
MKRFITLSMAVAAALSFAACDNDQTTGLEDSLLEKRSGPPGNSRYLTVMTRNLYVGGDVDPILEAAGAGRLDLIPGLVDQAFATMMLTNYPARAGAIADEIMEANPDLIGLQEVSVIQAGELEVDFLEILQMQLQARGLNYYVAGSVLNIEASVPSGLGVWVTLKDYDVVLARQDIDTYNAVGRNFATRYPPFVLGEQQLDILRGFVAVDAVVDGRTYRFVSTHPESGSGFGAQIRQGQIAELVDYLSDETLPVIIVGDLNTDGYTREPGYEIFMDAGYKDAWVRFAGKTQPGFTSGHDADLQNETATPFYHRIDLILASRLGWARVDIVGDDPSDRFPVEANGTAYWLWPSDHAGVVGQLHVPAQFRAEDY